MSERPVRRLVGRQDDRSGLLAPGRSTGLGGPESGHSKPIKGAPLETETKQYWETYLNDHRAGATAGTALVKRIWRSNRRNQWGPVIENVVETIEQDLVVLDEVRTASGVSGGDLKKMAALLTERAGRFKLNGHLLTYSPLSRVLELEALMSAVRGKQSLWVALRTAAPSHPEWAGFDFAALEKRGIEQMETLERIHEWAVTDMVGSQPQQ